MMLVRHGHIVAEGWWAPYHADQVQLVYSLSKSFTSTAAGLAITDGLFGLDDPVLDFFDEVDRTTVDPAFERLLVRHIASMSTGHVDDTLQRAIAATTADPDHPLSLPQAFFTIPPDQEPGTVFAYNNTATYLLGEIVRRRTGMTLTEWLRPRLFEPLGIERTPWDRLPTGGELGFSGLHVTTESIARFGQLYLDRGVWHGRRLLDAGWIEQATRPQVDNDRPDAGPDWRRGYGFQFWMARHGYRGDGAFGQFCLVLPEVDAVVALTSCTERLQDVLDAVWEHLLPALSGDAETTGDDRTAELTERLAGLELTPVATRIPPANAVAEYRFTAGAAGDSGAFGSLRALSVTAADGGWGLDLDLDHGQAHLVAGDGRWHPGLLPGRGGPDVPVHTCGGWTGQGRFELEISVDETPHRVLIGGDTGSGTLRTGWNVPPLGVSDPTDLGAGENGGPSQRAGSR